MENETQEKIVEAQAIKTASNAFAELAKNGVNDFTFRTGEALEQQEPIKVAIAGTIDAPLRWLAKRNRIGMIDQSKCHIIVNREKLSIALICNENDHYGTTVEGKLEESEAMAKFGINSYDYMTNFQLAELIKMNRSFFENRQVAMNLVTELRSFKAKVDKEIENADDTRGNRKQMINQIVESNLPEAFTLIIPVFKGQIAEEVECEVYVKPDDLTCTLVSPAANDIIQETRDKLIGQVLNDIETICPDIPIIEQ